MLRQEECEVKANLGYTPDSWIPEAAESDYLKSYSSPQIF